MAYATAHTVSLHGAVGHLIDVQADVSPGQVGFTLIGRADLALNEAKERCRMAIVNAGLQWPTTRRLTVLLAPADLVKRGTHLDLAIAVAILAACSEVERRELQATGFIGELTLAGGLRSVPGVLPMVLAAADRGIRRVFVPEPQIREASMVPGMQVLGVRSLQQVVAQLRGQRPPESPPVAEMSGSRLLNWRGKERLDELDFRDLYGVEDAKYAAEVAAAGGHAVLFSGPKGAGKTSIAERLPTILPPLAPDEALELTALHSLAGALEPGDGLITTAPYSAPHHDASKASLIGGGTAQVRPGEISRAHGGVLFLDEFPLFRSDVIEALRQPLESGEITVARAEESITLPARMMLVLACNPCPCGNYSEAPGGDRCRCSETKRRLYRSRIEGPIADRIDITRHVSPVKGPPDRLQPEECSATILERVVAARARQQRRYAECGWRLNSQVPGPALRDRWPLDRPGQALLDHDLYAGRLSSRGAVRVHRLAWTIADLSAASDDSAERVPGRTEVEVALRLRMGQPLLLRTIRRAG